MSEQKRRPVFLLDDSPAVADEFGSHERIANAILKLVTTEVGGKAIALTGSWGSGKSTVVNLLKHGKAAQGEQALPESENLEIFVFDAWAHEGDPLRRTFLEQLIACLVRKGWASAAKWNLKLAELSKRRKEATVTSTPRLTGIGTVFAVSAFFLPLGLALVSGSVSPLAYHIGITLCVLPILFLVGVWAWNSVRGKRISTGLVGLLVNKTEVVTKTETLESPEPTSLEFQTWFHELAAGALVLDRRLLIVIDNLDRVGTRDALRLWSSMRTFLDFTANELSRWAGNLWTLVPFDEDGIKRLWKSGEDESMGDAFLNKTFQIRFSVPPPLLSDWRSFFMDQLRQAFPEHGEEDFYTISRIYAILRVEEHPPTPRGIKLFVNRVGAVYRSSPEEMPLSQQALYVALSEHDWDPIRPLPAEDRLRPYLGADLRENLASLRFNMPKDKALQVLFGERVEKALTEGEADQIAELADKTGIEYVVERVLEQRLATWREKDPHLVALSAYALAAAMIPATLSWNAAWSRLLEAAQGIEAWPFLNTNSGKGLGALIRRADDSRFTRKLLSSVSTTVPATTSDEAEVSQKRQVQWVEGAIEVLEGAVAVGHESVVKEAFRFGPSAQDYLARLSAAGALKAKPDLSRYLRPSCEEDEVIKSLVEQVGQGNFSSKDEVACEVMLLVDCEWPWDTLTNSMQSRLQQAAATPTESGPCIRTLFRLRGMVDSAEAVLAGVTQQGWIFHHLQLAHQGNDHNEVASCMLAALLHEPEAGGGTNPGQAGQGRNAYRAIVAGPTQNKEVLERLVEQTQDLRCIEDILTKRTQTKIPNPTIDAILQSIARVPLSYKLLSPETITDHYRTLRGSLDESSLLQLIAASADHSGLADYLATIDFSLENASLYRTVLNATHSAGLIDATIRGLDALSKEEWSGALAREDDLIPLTVDLQAEKTKLNLGYPLRDGLTEIADKALSGQPPSHISGAVCGKLVQALSADQSEMLKRDLRDKVIAAPSSTGGLIELFSEALNDCTFLVEEADKLIREGFRKIWTRQDPIELAWLRGLLEKCPKLLEQCHRATKKDFKGRVKTLIEEGTRDEREPHALAIAKILGIKDEQQARNDQKEDGQKNN